MRRLAIAACFCLMNPAAAQQSTITTPNVGVSDGYSEYFGTNWSVGGRGWFISFGGNSPLSAAPGFGGFDPSAAAQGGFGFGGNGFGGRLNFIAGQGSSRGISGVAPSVTIPNGGLGGVIDTNYRPFVTEISPVVGESPIKARLRMGGIRPPLRRPDTNESTADESVTLREETRPAPSSAGISRGSSADRGDTSVAAIRRQQAEEDAAKAAEIASLLADAEKLEAAGELRAAASLFNRAAVKSEGNERERHLQKYRELRGRITKQS